MGRWVQKKKAARPLRTMTQVFPVPIKWLQDYLLVTAIGYALRKAVSVTFIALG